MTQQGDRQQSARDIAGTTTTHDGDLRAMFEAEATIAAGTTFNGAFIEWLQERTGSASTSLPGLMQQFAEDNSAHNWSSLGSFDPAGVSIRENLVGEWKFDEGAGTTAADSSGNGHDLTNLAGSWITGGFDFGTTAYDSGITAQTLGVDGAKPKTLIVVAKVAVATGNDLGVELTETVVGGNGERWTFRTGNLADDLRLEISGDAETEAALSITNDTWFFASAKTAGATLSTGSLSLNGTHAALSSAVVTIATDVAATLRINSLNTAAGQMDVGYLLLYDAALSDAQIDTLRSELTVIMDGRGVTLP